MCNNCNCENYDRCSIPGYAPIGFCCSKCELYDENRTCLNMKTHEEAKITKIKTISSTVENGILKVVLEQDEKEIPIFIDIQKQLKANGKPTQTT